MSLVCALCLKRYSAPEVKIGHGGQDELVGKSGITSNEKKGSVMSCGHIPFCRVVEMLNTRSASSLIIFSVFCLAGIFLFIFAMHFSTCFATVASRSSLCSRALEEMAQK